MMNALATPASFLPKRVAFLGNYAPRQCGIATFTFDLVTSYQQHLNQVGGNRRSFVVSVTDRPGTYEYPQEVKYDFPQDDLAAYRQAATYLREREVEVVCVQHEYGIYGGQAGEYLLTLLRELEVPIVTTLHTVLKTPDEHQRRVLRELARLSAQLVVMTERGRHFLETIYEVPAEKIAVIPHGIPDVPFAEETVPFKQKLGLPAGPMLLTFGLLSPNKGIEHVIRALPDVVLHAPHLKYVVLGATHPNLVRERGEAYRESLQQLARELGVAAHVEFRNQFVSLDDLTQYIQAADVYVTPYLNPAQITSGTLAYCFGCGKPIVSTPYWHAEELLADGRGVLVPFADPAALAGALIGLLEDPTRCEVMRRKAYELGREMIWSRVAARYDAVFAEAVRQVPTPGTRPVPLGRSLPMPALRLDHLHRLSDSTGLIQHARHTLPLREEGYCTDDNARALILTTWLDASSFVLDARLAGLSDSYAAFLQHAFDESTNRFRNFMSYGREWLETVGSDDSHGRALWSLGTLLAHTRRRDLRTWALELFDRAVRPIAQTTSPRAWAYALLGIHEYLTVFGGDRRVRALQLELAQRLVALHRETAQPHWFWFETALTYDNPRLCEALLTIPDVEIQELGLHALEWLRDVQTAREGHFWPIGNEGFYAFGQRRAVFDQQPLEAAAMVAAALRAYEFTGMEVWMREARKAFDWFLGRNDLGLALYDETSGGCFDGLQPDRVNRNQGAESTLAYLMAWTELKRAQEVARERIQQEELLGTASRG